MGVAGQVGEFWWPSPRAARESAEWERLTLRSKAAWSGIGRATRDLVVPAGRGGVGGGAKNEAVEESGPEEVKGSGGADRLGKNEPDVSVVRARGG